MCFACVCMPMCVCECAGHRKSSKNNGAANNADEQQRTAGQQGRQAGRLGRNRGKGEAENGERHRTEAGTIGKQAGGRQGAFRGGSNRLSKLPTAQWSMMH